MECQLYKRNLVILRVYWIIILGQWLIHRNECVYYVELHISQWKYFYGFIHDRYFNLCLFFLQNILIVYSGLANFLSSEQSHTYGLGKIDFSNSFLPFDHSNSSPCIQPIRSSCVFGYNIPVCVRYAALIFSFKRDKIWIFIKQEDKWWQKKDEKKSPKGVQKSGTLLSGSLRKALNWAKGGDGLAHREFSRQRQLWELKGQEKYLVFWDLLHLTGIHKIHKWAGDVRLEGVWSNQREIWIQGKTMLIQWAVRRLPGMWDQIWKKKRWVHII